MTIEISSKALNAFLKEEFNSITTNSRRLELQVFQLYFDYPFLFSQRLFELFDDESKGYLTKEDYISGFTNLYLGNTHVKLNTLFNFFDYSKDGLVFVEDIQLIINYLFSDTENTNEGITHSSSNYETHRKHDITSLLQYSNSKPISIKQMVDYFQLIDSSVFIIFYSYVYSKKTFTMELINSIGKKAFNKIHFESFFFQSLLSHSLINPLLDCKTIDFALKSCGVFIEKYIAVYRKKENEIKDGDDSNEDNEDSEDELNDLMSFEDDLINIKNNLAPTRKDSFQAAHSCSLFSNKNLNYASIDVNSMKKKSTQTSLPSISLCRKQRVITLNEDAFIAYLPKRNGKRIAMKIIDKFIIVYYYLKEERIYERLIPLKCLYINSSDSNNSNSANRDLDNSNQVQLASLLNAQNENDLTVSFYDQNDKSAFISLISSITHTRNISDYYSIMDEVSHGNMGDVQIGISKLDQSKVIIKTLHKQTFTNYYWEVEINKYIMRNPHVNVVKCHDIFDYYDKVVIIQEYIEFGSLFDLISISKPTINSVLVLDLVKQMINGLEYLHSNGIIHRDIKPNNILVKADSDCKYTIKYIDFGVSQMIFSKQTQMECVGTYLFIAPEIFSNLPYSFGVDLWSLGIVIFYLQFGYMPFSIQVNHSNNQIANSILTKDLIIPSYSKYNNKIDLEENNYHKINAILNKTLDKDQSKRQCCLEIKQDLY